MQESPQSTSDSRSNNSRYKGRIIYNIRYRDAREQRHMQESPQSTSDSRSNNSSRSSPSNSSSSRSQQKARLDRRPFRKARDSPYDARGDPDRVRRRDQRTVGRTRNNVTRGVQNSNKEMVTVGLPKTTLGRGFPFMKTRLPPKNCGKNKEQRHERGLE